MRERPHRPGGERRPDGGERGAALVEFALVVPLLMVLLLGSITSGLAFDQGQALAHSGREASRYGATLPVPASVTTWLDEVAAAARANADGNLSAGTQGRYLCVALIRDSGVNRRIEDATGVYYDNARCFDDGVSGRRVQVIAQRRVRIEALAFSRDFTMIKRASARFEAQP